MALLAMLRTEHLARELLDGMISKVYSQGELDEVRREAIKTLGGIPTYLESKLDGKGVKVLFADMTATALEVMGGSYYMRDEKTILLNKSDQFYIAEGGKVSVIPLGVVLYHELGHAHQHLIDGFPEDADRNVMEHDNIVRFEWPMCHKAGLPKRLNYNMHWGVTREGALANSARIMDHTTITAKLPSFRLA